MIISCPKEIFPGETRVALTPETAAKMAAWGYEIRVEKNAGTTAGFSDEAYQKAGATVVDNAYEDANILLKIWAPLPGEATQLRAGQTVLANFEALRYPDRITSFAALGITAFALDKLPRISRAQSMDILSSQSNLAGYCAILEAASLLPKAIPMMMTAAGTVPPARVLILGAGVAGLQAIATAKRLGAQVYAADVRSEVKEQVESLGARFVEVAPDKDFKTSGGYATATSEDYQRRQQEAITARLAQTDIVITTALIPGKSAPRLITAEMLRQMPQGGIVIDMATEYGGNVEGSKNNQTVYLNGITLIGDSNLAARLPASASTLFAQNLYNFLAAQYQAGEKRIMFNFDDELVAKTCICKDGEVI